MATATCMPNLSIYELVPLQTTSHSEEASGRKCIIEERRSDHQVEHADSIHTIITLAQGMRYYTLIPYADAKPP